MHFFLFQKSLSNFPVLFLLDRNCSSRDGPSRLHFFFMYLKISHRAYLSAAQRQYLLLPAILIQHYCFPIIPQLSCFPSIHSYSVTLIFHLLQEWFASIHLSSTKTFFPATVRREGKRQQKIHFRENQRGTNRPPQHMESMMSRP